MSLLYSHNGGVPSPLPHRITLRNGRTRTDSNTFTREEIQQAGYSLAPPKPTPAVGNKVDWVSNNWTEVPLEGAELKLSGVLFEGVMCSAMKEDMWGLNSVKGYVMAGGTAPFEFENGNTLVLTPDNYAAFELVWIPFRASFFGGNS